MFLISISSWLRVTSCNGSTFIPLQAKLLWHSYWKSSRIFSTPLRGFRYPSSLTLGSPHCQSFYIAVLSTEVWQNFLSHVFKNSLRCLWTKWRWKHLATPLSAASKDIDSTPRYLAHIWITLSVFCIKKIHFMRKRIHGWFLIKKKMCDALVLAIVLTILRCDFLNN